MAVKVRIPTPLQNLTDNKTEVDCNADSIDSMVKVLSEQYPGLQERLRDEEGNLRRFVNFFVNDEDIRFLDGDTTALKDGDVISIIPAIAGGSD